MPRLDDGFACERTAAHRFDSRADGSGVSRFQSLRNPHEGATSADGRHPAVDRTPELLENLRTGDPVRGNPLRGMELINVEAVTLGSDPARGFCRCSDIAAGHLTRGAINLFDEHDFGAQSFQHPRTSRTVSSRHRNDQRMTQRSAGDCQACSHVAAGHFNNGCTRSQPAVVASREQNSPCGSVLHAAARLQKLHLGDDSTRTTINPVQCDQWSSADKIDRRFNEQVSLQYIRWQHACKILHTRPWTEMHEKPIKYGVFAR